MRPKGPKPRQSFVLCVMLCVVWVLMFSGCIPSTSAGKKYFQLYLPMVPVVESGEKAAPTSTKILLVNTVEVEKIYNDYRVVYRVSPYQLNYYYYNYWIKKPEILVREAIVEYLSGINAFKQVTTGFSGGDPDLQLTAKVYILEESDQGNSWFAHLKMDIVVRDFKSGQQVVFHSFDRQKQIMQKKVERLPVLISKILKEEIDKMIGKLAVE